ncbi:MAG: 2,4-dihydroxyhept-2-ene-1,7-dioic acid aldolase [Gammaproteobacteria bacterium]|nr:2,4-dihydroxyhept-2-ene-1,7-dioic acid aldolase [Gammaproteobacteria bacterium]
MSSASASPESHTAASSNALRARIAAGRPGIGLLVSMPSPHMVQALAGAGFDWVFIDMEHGPISIESAHAMIMATRGTATAPLVRVPWNEHWLVKPVLDAGAMGVIFPMIKSAEEARAAVAALRYPPIGDRGFGPFYASYRFGTDMRSYPDIADREIMCVLLIEHKDAIDDIENIARVEGVDACLIAPNDLSMSYGHRDGPNHPEVQQAIARAEAALLPSGIAVGGLAPDNALANQMIDKGYRLILTGYDTLLIDRGARAILDGLNR